MRFDCIPPEFSPFRNFKKNIGKLNSLTVRKKKKKIIPTDPIFKFWSGEGNISFFFFGLRPEFSERVYSGIHNPNPNSNSNPYLWSIGPLVYI